MPSIRTVVAIAALGAMLAAPAAGQTNTGGPADPITGHRLTPVDQLRGITAILYAPSNGDDPAYRADIAAAAGGAVVDYFDARIATPDVALLSAYDAVYVWINSACDDNILYGDNLADYVDAGGKVVLGAFCTYTGGYYLDGRIMTPGYSPVHSPTGGNHYSLSAWAGGHFTSIHDRVTSYDCTFRDELAVQGRGLADGYYEDGEIAHAYRPDFRVVYSNGLGGTTGGSGDWPLLVANSMRRGDITRVLVYDDTFEQVMTQAARNLGMVVVATASEAEFLAQYGAGTWDIIVLENSLNGMPPAVATTVESHVAAGGRALLSYWDLDGNYDAPVAATLRTTFQVATASEFTDPMDVYSWRPNHPLWRTPHFVSMLTVASLALLDNGDRLVGEPGTFEAGGFTDGPVAGEAAVLVGNECRTIVDGFMMDNMDLPVAIQCAEDQLRYLATRDGTLLLEMGSAHGLARRAAWGAGLRPAWTGSPEESVEELTTCDWDIVLVDPPCCSLSAVFQAELDSYIADGGRVVFSYWNLDAEPTLQTMFGIAGTIDFFAPLDIYEWSASHPIWNAPHPVPSPIGLSGEDHVNDNGDRMEPAAGASAIAGFTATATPFEAAIVLANGNRTVLNGFEYDGLDSTNVLDLLENEIDYVTTALPGNLFRRGDANDDGAIDISDSVYVLAFLFSSGPDLHCADAGDGNDDGALDISDAVYLLAALFSGGPPPPAPGGTCGPDPTPDPLPCGPVLTCP